MGIFYRSRTTKNGEVELYSRQFDGVETDINSIGYMSAAEADGLAMELMEAAAKAREVEREILNKRRETLTNEAIRIKGELESVMREIASIDERQARTRAVDASGHEHGGHGSHVAAS